MPNIDSEKGKQRFGFSHDGETFHEAPGYVDDQGGAHGYQVTDGGLIKSYIENPHELIVNEHFHFHTAISTTLADDVPSQSVRIPVDDPTGINVGDELQIENGTIEVTFPVVTVITGSILTLDRPLDNGFLIGDLVTVVETDFSTIAGTLDAPISYKVIPSAGEEWGIARILLAFIMSGAGDDSKFGNLPALTNGVVLRVYDGVNDQFTTLTNWKANSDIIHDGYDSTYNDKAGGGLFGFISRWTFRRIGAEPKIHGDHGDYFELLVQDDLAGLVNAQLKDQGFVDD